ncbi:hypothetical protein BO71DRAFT_426720 [Aspergillus ellipticus CBS 707.79]|uniref:Uncharacterized protein n=1 Tax=Aspergillus ellipticus CBS 707.79 TaxID=1448320 RepID=A0A319EAU1_9EURO|nr:hypothetical protein BO71DRAFT_426720 [Aspergillus ellipticus CBS 707.79]
MFVFPKFPHFDNNEVNKAIRLLNQSFYPIMQLSERIEAEFLVYIEQYEEQMRLLSTRIDNA